MTLAYDFVRAGVLIIISAVIHRMGVELFAPGGVLYDTATSGTANVNGAYHANLWYQIIVVWVPLAVAGFALAFVLIRIYRRQVQTAAARAPR